MGQIMTVTNISRFLAAFLFLASSASAVAQGSPFALINANLFNGIEEKITEHVTVFVRDGLIECIATGDVHISVGYEVIDAEYVHFLMLEGGQC